MTVPRIELDGSFEVDVYFISGENPGCIAVAPELNLIGDGDTWEEAKQQLGKFVQAQVASAAIRNPNTLGDIFVSAKQACLSLWLVIFGDGIKPREINYRDTLRVTLTRVDLSYVREALGEDTK